MKSNVSPATSALLPPALAGMRPVALLLDFDGVVVDSVKVKVDAYLQIYHGEAADKLRAVAAHQRLHGGVTRSVMFRYFETEIFGRSVSDESIRALSAAYTQQVHAAVLGSPLIPGARALLERARGHAAVHVISGTPQEELDDIVVRRGLAPYFVSWRGAPTTKIAAFREIIENRAYAPERVLAIGDALTELEAATTLGIPFLGICSDEAMQFPPGVPVLPSLEGVSEALGFS